MLLTAIAFLVALGLLIAIHEYGHYRVAVACGVKVLRFSVGFGKPLLRWQPRGSSTEFVLGAFPLGGYVRMLDEREGPVDPAERHRAFNTQPVRVRAAIVAAGPAANLLLAIVLYALVNWSGIEEPRAVLASPAADTIAYEAGLRGGEQVQSVAIGGEPLQAVRSFEEVRWKLVRATLDGQDVRLQAEPEPGAEMRLYHLDLSRLPVRDADPAMLRRIGVVAPWTQPVLGQIMPDGAAQQAGLQSGDRVRRVGDTAVRDGQQLRELIRLAVHEGQARTQTWEVERNGRLLQLRVTPAVHHADDGQTVGRIGAYVGSPPEMVTVRYGFWEGLKNGAARTWEISVLTLRMIGRMVIGEASLKNLSGPLTIADYAGRSASMGWTQYLAFLALISVSLGVLNLLPLPVLDGGHLMYYLWEGVTGKSIPEVWLERLQRGGVAVLLLMMGIALFNDVTRLFG